MPRLPCLDRYGYHLEDVLGFNRGGGRVTYRGIQLATGRSVAIKQFRFAHQDADWSAYRQCEREAQVLRDLDHPGIPRYRDHFETEDGFCLVQDYIAGRSLGEPRSFDPDTLHRVMVSLLEILIYLHNRVPPVIHRDLKPENVLIAEATDAEPARVYLVDFGLARLGTGEGSSTIAGTLGFMAPEQVFQQRTVPASDLYGLGATIICAICGLRSHQIGLLMDDREFRLHFRDRAPSQLSLRWLAWLEQLVEPRLGDRFPSAQAALDALRPIDLVRVPTVTGLPDSLHLVAPTFQRSLTARLRLVNPVPETTLQGEWEVAPHPHDPPGDPHAWIHVLPLTPKPKSGDRRALPSAVSAPPRVIPSSAPNSAPSSALILHSSLAQTLIYRVQVDLRRLMAGRTYHRQLQFRSNAQDPVITVDLAITTARIPTRVPILPWGVLLALAGSAATVTAVTLWVWQPAIAALGLMGWVALGVTGVVAIATGAMCAAVGRWLGNGLTRLVCRRADPSAGFQQVWLSGWLVAIALALPSLFPADPLMVVGCFGLLAIGFGLERATELVIAQRFAPALALVVAGLTATVGSLLTMIAWVGAVPWAIAALVLTGLPLAVATSYPAVQQARAVARYRRQEGDRIWP
jgi:serine/threonine protein kinase